MACIDNKKTLNANMNACVHMVGRSIIGTRQYQQDAFYTCYNGDTCLAVICDGMGGMEHGGLASNVAIEILAKDYDEISIIENPYVFLRKEAIKIDTAVASLRDEQGNLLDTGTTIVAVFARNNKIWWLSVGDSRIYVVRKKQFSAVNKEHNYKFSLNKRLENHEISEEEYKKELKQAGALISYIGMGGIELIDQNTIPFEMQPLDRFILCSDGLINALGEEQVKEIVQTHPMDIDEALEELVRSVELSDKKHIDNTTVVLLSYE